MSHITRSVYFMLGSTYFLKISHIIPIPWLSSVCFVTSIFILIGISIHYASKFIIWISDFFDSYNEKRKENILNMPSNLPQNKTI